MAVLALLTSVLSFAPSTLASVLLDDRGAVPVCYAPSGAVAEDNYACNLTSEYSFCCSPGYTCLDNKVCQGDATFDDVPEPSARGTCTDPTWVSQDCPQFCRDELPTGGDLVVQCSEELDQVCCIDPLALEPLLCCTNLSATIYTLTGAWLGFTTISSADSTVTQSLISTTSQTTTSAASNSASTTSDTTTSDASVSASSTSALFTSTSPALSSASSNNLSKGSQQE